MITLDTPVRYFFRKPDKLKSRKQIEALFEKGERYSAFPLKVWWLHENATSTLQAGVGVSTRYFKKAVDRNRIKRLMREAYRLQKEELAGLLTGKKSKLSVFILFTGKELPDYEMIYKTTGTVIKKLIHAVNQKAE